VDQSQIVDLGQRTVSDADAVPPDHEPEPTYLAVVGLTAPTPVLAEPEE
jgi:hypothetical protein